MDENSRPRDGKLWLKASVLISLAVLFAFNAWVSWISNGDKYWSEDPPDFVSNLRNIKVINIFQLFADAAGYHNYLPPGQFIRYFVWLFSLLTVFILYLVLRLFGVIKTAEDLHQVSGRVTHPLKPETNASLAANRTQQIPCPSCGNICIVSSQLVGSIRCKCGATIKVDHGSFSLVSPPSTPNRPPDGPRKNEQGGNASSPHAAFEHYIYCVSFVNEIARQHGVNSREMDEVWPVMIQALGHAVGMFKAMELRGEINPESDLAEKFVFLMKEAEKVLTR